MNIPHSFRILRRLSPIAALAGIAFGAGARAATTNVVFDDFSYSPETVTIQVGDTVVWTNAGGVHTVTGDGEDPFCGPDAISTSCSETFMSAGTFPYHCVFHRSLGMVGTVIVMSGTVTNPPTETNRITDPIPARIPKGNISVELHPVGEGLTSPLGLQVPDDGSGRMIVYDQIGLIHVIQQGTLLPEPLLDIRDRLVALDPGYDERGLIGFAIHTNFAEHPLIYTYTSEPNGPVADFSVTPEGATNTHQQVIAEWRIDAANSNRVDVGSRREILRIDKPQANHNGGTMHFGPDGLLYFAVGDGGRADDEGPGHLPGGNAQNKTTILGKINRIDVDARTSANGQYGVPADNPFVGEPTSVHEIYAYGVRNPFSFSFDSATGELYLGDVGQNDVEEIDRVSRGDNLGWVIKEGSFYFDGNGTNDGFVTSVPVSEVPAGLVDPIAEYDHDDGQAVIGGFVYHGTSIPGLDGKYVFGELGGDNGGGRLFYLDGTDIKELVIGPGDQPLGFFLKGFGQDDLGEIYVLGTTNIGPSGNDGRVLKLAGAGTNTVPNAFVTHSLISDLPGLADAVDPNLVNPWGLAFNAAGPFWVANNKTGLSTIYNSTGGVQLLVVTIPAPGDATAPSTPTGIIFNNTTNFIVNDGPARFIFATEEGTIAAWNGGSNAVITADRSSAEATYKGLALGTDGTSNRLYAANFHAGTIDVFDHNFLPLVQPEAFIDPDMATNFAPFNVEVFNGKLYVTYALVDEAREDDVPGDGAGFVNVYNLDGSLGSRLISGGHLNAPWGLAIAPEGFAPFPGALLVGNFGDGAINAYTATDGTFLGALQDVSGTPIRVEGLWAIKFGNGGQAGDPNVLYFTAGPGDEEHGLFGSIAPVGYLRILKPALAEGSVVLSWVGGIPPFLVEQKSALTDPDWVDVGTTTNLTFMIQVNQPSGFFRVSDKASTPSP